MLPLATANAPPHATKIEIGSPTTVHSTYEAEAIGEVENEKEYGEKARSSQDSLRRTWSALRSPSDGVNVKKAEAEFAELSKEFSHSSNHHDRLSRQQSKQSRHGGSKLKDEEKTVGVSASESDDTKTPFDLEATLRGNKGEEEASGIKSKRIGVVWEDLTVSGVGGVKNYVKIFPYAFWSFFNVYGTVRSIFGWGKKGTEFNILQDFKGVLKPGEMCLVLGRPGSGCTTFLKVVANQRFGYTNIEGEVLYGQFDSQTFGNKYRGEAVYNGEDDVHHPTLTVGQTLDFALDMKVPGKRPAGLSRHDFKDRVIDLMLNMFNIVHTKNTIVGNPFVRGISGGERKRVSIAEMMCTGATVCSWDNSYEARHAPLMHAVFSLLCD